MTKTPLQSRYLRILADLNDQFCYFLFARTELRTRFQNFAPEIGNAFLPTVFANNPYAPKINIQIDQVPGFEADHERVTFGAYISTSYEIASSYLEDAIELLSQCNGATFKGQNERSPEATYWKTLAASNCAPPDAELRMTLTYIRLRRNHFIHLATSLSNRPTQLLKNDGPNLNNY